MAEFSGYPAPERRLGAVGPADLHLPPTQPIDVTALILAAVAAEKSAARSS